MTSNNVIGHKGDIPWALKEEMAHFKKSTTEPKSTVIMGHKTYLSLLPYNKNGYLENRYNVVLSRSSLKCDEDQMKVGRGHEYLSFMTSYGLDKASLKRIGQANGTASVFIIGGAQVYSWALVNNLVDEIILTKIKYKLKGDTKLTFPSLDEDFTLLSIDNREDFDILHYQRAH